jgi:predicted nuclease of predicted toxin-antitoxin system
VTVAGLRFLFDENMSREIGSIASEEGHHAACLVDRRKGTEDSDVLAEAARENSIVVTEDMDFGRLVFAERMTSAGVILIRIAPWKQELRHDRFRWLLREHPDRLGGSFTVLGEKTWRVRAILAGDGN